MIKKVLIGFVFAMSLGGVAEPVVTPKIKPSEPLPANLFIELAKAVNPAVVNVFTTTLPTMRPGMDQRDPFFELFEQFMGPQQYGRGMPQQSLGTGFIIREDGLIVTNNHVIDHADVIKVQISEDTKENFDAKLVGKDPRTDIALIKIDAKKKLPYVKLGTSADVQVGEWVAAFGNPYGYGHTMTKGIISAVGREIEELNMFPFMQTDASINPGNSGGPLVNTQGQVIGVNTAIDARAQGIGFVIPIDNVKAILPQLEKDGTIQRGFIGVGLADIDPDRAASLNMKQTEGTVVIQVQPGMAADKAGVQPYDLIVGLGERKITSAHDLSKAIIETPVGKVIPLKVIRNGRPKTLSLTIGSEAQPRLARATVGKRSDEQKAPFGLGFSVSDYSPAIGQEFHLPKMGLPKPVVVAVESGSEAANAGMAPGDVILDVNRNGTVKAKDVVRGLRRGTINILRILKQDRVVLVSLRAQ